MSVNRIILGLAVMALLIAGPGDALAKKKKPKPPRWEWGLALSASANYNSNLIGLSERDRNQFLRNPNSFPTPLETADDLESEWTVRPSVRWRAPANLWLNGDYRFKWNHRLKNSFTDYQAHSFGVSVRPRKSDARWQVRARVLAIPSFYLRVYNDKDWNEYHAARFANWYFSGAFRYKLSKSLHIEPEAGFGTFYYNRKFTEYDSEYRDFGAALQYRAGDWDFALGYLCRLSDNVGKDQLGGAPAIADPFVDSEYGDSDFSEDEWNAGVGGDLAFITWRPVQLDLSYKWRRRVYTTDRSVELDPFHRGRLDKRGQLTVTLTTKLNDQFSIDLFSGYDQRGSNSPRVSVPAVKDFVRHEYGVRLNVKVR